MFDIIKRALKKIDMTIEIKGPLMKLATLGVGVDGADKNPEIAITALTNHYTCGSYVKLVPLIDTDNARENCKALQEEFNARTKAAGKKIPTEQSQQPAQQPEQFQPISKPSTPLPVNSKSASVTEKLRWKVDGKTLTVGGVHEIKDYSREEPPWLDSLQNIQKIIIEDGVEKISANAFIDCKRLELLTIPASVKTIGNLAFTACYCGNRLENGGRNVFWSLNEEILMIRKNPAVKSEANFSTGFETWEVVEKNITSVKIERGIVLGKRFFEWLNRLNVDLPVQIL